MDKGGDYRNWYGNLEHVVNWENDGYALQHTLHPDGKRIWAHNFVLDSIFKEAIVWSKITSSKPCFRYSPSGMLFDDASGVCTFEKGSKELLIGLLCSTVNLKVQKLVNPTLNIQPANIKEIPLPEKIDQIDFKVINDLIDLSKEDWDLFETSWNFKLENLVSCLDKVNRQYLEYVSSKRNVPIFL